MSFFLNPALACDYYKIGHATKMQPEGVERVYSTWTARNNKYHGNCKYTVVFGYQYTIQKLVEFFNDNFFSQSLSSLKADFEIMIKNSFNPIYADFSKFEALWHLNRLPLTIMGVPEGTLLPVGIPDHVIWNTEPEFAWLPQFIEDMWSANNWLPSTSATTAFYRKQMMKECVEKTCDSMESLNHMCGDFSLRGHTSLEAGYISGAAHLLSFDRTATIGANKLIQKYYHTHSIAGMGTPSLEHSVVEQGIACFKQRIINNDIPDYMKPYLIEVTKNDNWEINLIAEMCFILYLLKEVQPTGVMTYVADTYDYWGVLTKILPVIKSAIINRDGCFSIRPDSGNPIDIICGNENSDNIYEKLGTINVLMEIFGNTINSKNCYQLPKQIRMIYGDAITPEITEKVCNWCIENNIALDNICFGIGAYTYQYVTRDTRGYAIKATNCCHKDYGEMLLYKEPKTDSAKKSVRGCIAVVKHDDNYYCIDNLTLEEALSYNGNIMVTKLDDGKVVNTESFEKIRERLDEETARIEGLSNE